jgi:hypothetical protein
MILTISEVFEKFEKAETDADRINVLRANNTRTLRKVLACAFNPNIQFTTEGRWPNWKPSDVPTGVTYSDLHREFDRVYLFIANHPKRPPTLAEKRSNELLIQMLEIMPQGDAIVLLNMMGKNLKVKGLTQEIAEAAFANVLNESI